MENLVYEASMMDANKTEIGKNELHEILFFPKAGNLVGYIAEGIKQKDPSFKFFGKNGSWSVLNHIVQTQFNQSFGSINLQYLLKAIEEVGQTYEYIDFLNRSDFKGLEVLEEVEDNIIGYVELTEDYVDGDKDPYETAGGYRSWKALKGTIASIHLNKDLSSTLKFDSNCTIDHYNNNFAGVSTGGGTTKYEIGERVEKRSVQVDTKGLFWENWTKMPIQTKAISVCKNNIERLLNEYQPELYEVVKKKGTY
jgi:hypothetical protein